MQPQFTRHVGRKRSLTAGAVKGLRTRCRWLGCPACRPGCAIRQSRTSSHRLSPWGAILQHRSSTLSALTPPNSGTLRTPLEPGVSWNGHGSACPRWTGIRSWLFEIYLRSEYRWSQTPPLAWRAIAEIERTSRLWPERVYGICRSELALKVGLRHTDTTPELQRLMTVTHWRTPPQVSPTTRRVYK